MFHDYMTTVGGAERLVLAFAKHFRADVYTTALDPGLMARAGYGDVRVTSLGDLIPRTPWKQIQASWMFARCRLEGYDRYVMSGNWAHFAAKRHHPNLWYCHTPTRLFYDQRQATLARLSPARRLAAHAWFATHGAWDRRAVRHCDRIVANSKNVQGRIRRYYGRVADIVHPPVDTSRFRFQELGDFWLSVGRLYPEKRIELQLDIFRRMPDERLILVGGYSRGDRTEEYLRTLDVPPNVTLAGEVPFEALVDLYARCRGLLATAVDEDFGLTPIEAMASGKCVLATDEGGYRETIVHGATGFLLPPTPEAFCEKIRSLDDDTLRSMREACVERARMFDEAVFYERMAALLKER